MRPLEPWLVGAALLTALGAAPAAADEDARRLTLGEALQLADAAPAGRTVALEVERARAEVRGAGLWANPEISLSREEAGGSIDRFANVLLPIPWTGRLSLEKSAAERGALASEKRARQGRVEVHARVREAFLDLLAAQAGVAALDAGLGELDALLRMLRAREREGETSGFDRRRAERERAEVEADALQARGQLRSRRATLAATLAVLSIGLVAEGTLEGALTLPSPDEVRAQALARGDVLALDSEAEGQDLLAQAAGRRAWPEPTLEAGAKSTEVGGVTDHGAVFGVSFSLNLFDHGQGAKAAARAEALLLRTRREALARAAEAEAEGALAEAGARHEAESAYAAAADADELARIARAAYEEGEMRILELLDAYRSALAARLRLIALRVEARSAEIALDRATGVERLP
jgi:cobalt-zinc-cadmium efflux system outer membrane protein